jgi:hypothetical protein
MQLSLQTKKTTSNADTTRGILILVSKKLLTGMSKTAINKPKNIGIIIFWATIAI